MNPGEFKEMMDILVPLKVNRKFNVENVNVHVTDSYEMEENLHKKTQHKLVLRLTRRKFPTLTTSPTLLLYPTDQKIMIQGSLHGQAMGEKEFLLPLVKKVLIGKEEKIISTNKVIKKSNLNLKKRKTRCSFNCDH